MKTKLAVAIALSLLASSTFAAPTLYGEIDASVDYLPENNSGKADRDTWEVNSNSSFIGIKGEEKLTDRLDAVYGIEWTFYTDGDKSDFDQRNRFVGLKDAKFGTIKIGKHDTPLKQLSSSVDTFNNYVGNTADVTGIMTGENRLDNVVLYESPTIALPNGTVKFNGLLSSGENSGIKKSSGGVKAGTTDAYSASIVYDNKVIVAGLGYDHAVPSNFAGRGFLNASAPELGGKAIFAAADTARAVGRLNLEGGLALKALYQTSEVNDDVGNDVAASNIDDAQGWLVGAEYNLPTAKAWTLKAQYSQNITSFKKGVEDFEANQVFVGADYAFNKQVKAYGHAGFLTLEQGDLEDKQPVVGTGLEFKF